MFNLFKLRKPKSIKLMKEQMKFLTKCIIKATKRKPKFTFKTYLKNKGGHLFDCEINNGGKCDCQPCEFKDAFTGKPLSKNCPLCSSKDKV